MSKLTAEHQQLLKELARSGQGKALKVLIDECLEEIGDVSKCTSWEDTIGRKHAKEFLIETFKFLDKPETNTPRRTLYT
jgi:hypothetical protein